MRKLRVLSVIIFVISAGMFAWFHLIDDKTADRDGPVIQMDGERIEVSAEAGEDELLAGITALDEKDGDVSESLVIESMTNFAERGRRTASIAAFDSDNNVTKTTREIVYTNYTPPSFSLEEPLYFPLNTESFTDGLTVSDILDGDLTQNIKMSTENEIQMNTAGEYPVVFSVSNSAGDVSSLPVTVTIYDPSKTQGIPLISLSQYLIHIRIGETIDPWNYMDAVSFQGTVYRPEPDGMGGMILAESSEALTEGMERKYLTDIGIINPVDTNMPGTYEITYRVSTGGEYENEAGTVRLVVVVDEQGGVTGE